VVRSIEQEGKKEETATEGYFFNCWILQENMVKQRKRIRISIAQRAASIKEEKPNMETCI